MAAPTPRQLEALKRMGIHPPPTEAVCKQFLSYIHRGGDRGGERIAIIKAAQSKYGGKRITHLNGRGGGKVLYLQCRGVGVRVNMRSSRQHQFSHPLDAYVEWDDGSRSTTSVGSLRLEGEVATDLEV